MRLINECRPEIDSIPLTRSSLHASWLRRELCQRNAAYARAHDLPHVESYGEMATIVYEPFAETTRHGNFLDSSYRAILRRQDWKQRLEKIHAQAASSLPHSDRTWKELDSSMSSDALLMNVFCHPATLKSGVLRSVLSTEVRVLPEFGFKARVPLLNGRKDRTEIDMKLDTLLVEAKLTESDFQSQRWEIVEAYRDLNELFDRKRLPRQGERYLAYQLIRNVLAAHALGCSFCALLDSRRPDLIEACYRVLKCIRLPELRTRCKVLTWQELSRLLAPDLQSFLDFKYGIVPPGNSASTCGTTEQAWEA